MLITATLNRTRNTQSSDSLLYHLSPLQITFIHCLDEMERSGNRKLRSAEAGGIGNFDLNFFHVAYCTFYSKLRRYLVKCHLLWERNIRFTDALVKQQPYMAWVVGVISFVLWRKEL